MARERLIKSRRSDMTDRQYTAHARSEAAGWGNAALFWIKDGDVKEAKRHARNAARWALKLLDAPKEGKK